MLKKLSFLAIVFILISVSSMEVFAGKTEGTDIVQNDAATGVVTTTSLDKLSGEPDEAAADATGITPADGSDAAAITKSSADKEEVKVDKTTKSSVEIEIEKVLKDGKAFDNGQSIMTITSPEKDKESTYFKDYILSGKSEYDDIVVMAARFNEKSGEYKLIRNTSGERTWETTSGLFSTEIELNMGANKLMIITYRKSQSEEPKLQVNCYTIELLNESILDRVIKKSTEIVKKTAEIGDNISKYFGGKSK